MGGIRGFISVCKILFRDSRNLIRSGGTGERDGCDLREEFEDFMDGSSRCSKNGRGDGLFMGVVNGISTASFSECYHTYSSVTFEFPLGVPYFPLSPPLSNHVSNYATIPNPLSCPINQP